MLLVFHGIEMVIFQVWMHESQSFQFSMKSIISSEINQVDLFQRLNDCFLQQGVNGGNTTT